MVVYTVKISSDARNSLQDIWNYISQDKSVATADLVVDRILIAIEKQETFPALNEREHYLNS